MNDAVERFKNEAYSLYFDVLNRYRQSLRRATSRLDRENQYQSSRDDLMRRLDEMKRSVLRQYEHEKVYSSLSEALDTEIHNYLQRFDREAYL